MRLPCLLAIAFLLPVPSASADTIQAFFNTSVLADVSSPSDNYYGEYSTLNQVLFLPHLGNSGVVVNIPNFTLLLPTGSVITSATTHISANYYNVGTGYLYTGPRFAPPNWDEPSIAPTFTNTGTSEVDVESVYSNVRPTIDGNQVYLDNASVYFELDGTITGFMETPGVNWSGYIRGSGQVTIPYTVELDVTYSTVPVPEPSTFALLATGILGLTGAIHRRLTEIN